MWVGIMIRKVTSMVGINIVSFSAVGRSSSIALDTERERERDRE